MLGNISIGTLNLVISFKPIDVGRFKKKNFAHWYGCTEGV